MALSLSTSRLCSASALEAQADSLASIASISQRLPRQPFPKCRSNARRASVFSPGTPQSAPVTPTCAAGSPKSQRGGISGKQLKFGVVVALFNDIVTKPLLAGALDTFERHGVNVGEDVQVAYVPGSFELPVVAQKMAKSKKYDAILCIGTVVRGSTTHYDAVANSAASGILNVSINTGVPCIFGVLTCETMEQAMDRAGGKLGNKGSEAALTAIEMANLMKQL